MVKVHWAQSNGCEQWRGLPS